MTYKELGQFVKKERKKLHLTQMELADLAEVSLRTLKNLEGGNRVYLETLKKIFNYLGYDIKLVSRSDAFEADL